MIIVQHQQKEVSKTSGILFLILSNILYIIIPLYLLVIAAFSITKCPSNQFLPLWPVIVAVLIIIDRVIFWKILYNETKFEKNFPRPEIDDLDHIRAWEKDRLRSSSKILVLLKTNLRIVFFLAVLFGLVWSHDLLFKDDQCKPLLVFSIFLFSFVSLVCYLVSFIVPLVLTNAALAVSTLGFIYYGVTNFLLRTENEWTTIVPCWMFLQICLILIERILFWRQEFGQVYFTGMIKYFYIGWRILTFLSSILGTFLLFFLVLASVSDAPMSSLFAAGFIFGLLTTIIYSCIFIKAIVDFCILKSDASSEHTLIIPV